MKDLILFETLRTVDNGKSYLWLEEHLERLEASLEAVYIHYTVDIESIGKQLDSLLPFEKDIRLKIVCGIHDAWFEITALESLEVSAGVIVRDSVFQRPNCRYKYQTEVYKSYAPTATDTWFETVFVDKKGFVREGNITNIFFLFENVLVTPPEDTCLAGIARQKVLEEAKASGMKTEERSITKTEALSASAMFLTNGVRGIIPVKSWGDIQFEGVDLPFHKSFDF